MRLDKNMKALGALHILEETTLRARMGGLGDILGTMEAISGHIMEGVGINY